MKKIIAILLCTMLLGSLLTGCECEHQYTSKVTREPTYETEGETTFYCSNCGDVYTEAIPMLERHIVPESVLNDSLSGIKYQAGPFTITLGRLINAGVSNYEITYLPAEEAISQGYLSRSEIDSSADIDLVYYVVVSGDTKINPEIPYYTEYNEEAVVGWMSFDESDNLVLYKLAVCKNLQTFAILYAN